MKIILLNVDNLTYASDYAIQGLESYSNYKFIKGDISDRNFTQSIFSKYQIDYVIHLAAESHVDNPTENPLVFVKTNILGTINLLDQARLNWSKDFSHLFYAISTDEVFGSLDKIGAFHEDSPINQNLLIRLLKLVQIILLEHMGILIIYHILFQIVQIIMAQTNTLKN